MHDADPSCHAPLPFFQEETGGHSSLGQVLLDIVSPVELDAEQRQKHDGDDAGDENQQENVPIHGVSE